MPFSTIMLVALGAMVLMMFLGSSKQRKLQRAQQEMLASLQVGDEVRTHSGFFGLIAEIYDDIVILESESGDHLKWSRAAIAQKVDPTPEEVQDQESTQRPEDSGTVPGVTTDSTER